MIDTGPGRVARWLLAGAILALGSAVVAAELPELTETVEVRVVNVDVVVTDAEGHPVRGLERGDFELRVDGRPVEIGYFSPVVGGLRAGVDGDAGHRGPTGMADLPFLVIAYDGRGIAAAGARDALAELQIRLGELLDRTRAVMVVRQGRSLVVEQPLTRDRQRLAAALVRLAERRTPTIDLAGRSTLLREIENTDPPQEAFESEDDQMVDKARNLLRQIRTQAEIERFDVDGTTRQLRSLLRSLAGLPGRKAILYIGEGLRLQPAEALYRLWWSKYGRYASRLGIHTIESELSPVRSDQGLARLVEEANAHRVSFYSYDAGGLRAVGGSAEFASLEANQQLAQETERRLSSLADLAVATGGIGDIRSSRPTTLIDEMLDGFDSFYSLGFEPAERQRGSIRVRLRQPGLRLRYLNRFVVRTAAQLLEEATLATLLTEGGDNRLEVGVEMGEPELLEDGTYLMPMLVKVPLARLALLPRRAHHVGKLSFVFIARSAAGELAPPARGEMPIEIANGDLLSAMAGTASYHLRLRVAAGEQTLAIGVRDEVARADATLRLVLAPGRDV